MKNKRPANGEPTIRDLLSYQIGAVAGAMSRGASLRYRDLGANLGEWRAIALLGACETANLVELARRAGLDKAQVSRVVSALLKRGLVKRAENLSYGRTMPLQLTSEGRKLYQALMSAALERDRAFRSCLSDDELTMFRSALHKLEIVARALAQTSQQA